MLTSDSPFPLTNSSINISPNTGQGKGVFKGNDSGTYLEAPQIDNEFMGDCAIDTTEENGVMLLLFQKRN
jgi:hypothetical protein